VNGKARRATGKARTFGGLGKLDLRQRFAGRQFSLGTFKNPLGPTDGARSGLLRSLFLSSSLGLGCSEQIVVRGIKGCLFMRLVSLAEQKATSATRKEAVRRWSLPAYKWFRATIDNCEIPWMCRTSREESFVVVSCEAGMSQRGGVGEHARHAVRTLRRLVLTQDAGWHP
jgi:hypothetical protein